MGQYERARTEGSCEQSNLVYTGEGLTDQAQEGYGEANGHVLVEYFGLLRGRETSVDDGSTPKE